MKLLRVRNPAIYAARDESASTANRVYAALRANSRNCAGPPGECWIPSSSPSSDSDQRQEQPVLSTGIDRARNLQQPKPTNLTVSQILVSVPSGAAWAT